MLRFGSAALLAAALASNAGCSSGKQYRVVTGKPRAALEGHVQISRQQEPVPPGFEAVAIVQAVDSGKSITPERLLGSLADEARALGCNAVVRVHVALAHGTQEGVAVGVAGVVLPPPSSKGHGAEDAAAHTDRKDDFAALRLERRKHSAWQ